jgi:hypothetical protein
LPCAAEAFFFHLPQNIMKRSQKNDWMAKTAQYRDERMKNEMKGANKVYVRSNSGDSMHLDVAHHPLHNPAAGSGQS